jgi:exopolysaccharide biosynthesis polyprenyl glycosylphosphotransferase
LVDVSTGAAQDAVSVRARISEPGVANGRHRISRARLSRQTMGFLALEWVGGVVAGVGAALYMSVVSWLAVGVSLATWSCATYCSSVATGVKTRGQLVRQRLASGLWTCCAVAVGAVTLVMQPATARDCLLVVAASTTMATLVLLLWLPRRREHRVLLVGESAHVAALSQQIHEAPTLEVAGACVVRTRRAIPVRSPSRVPTTFALSEVPELVQQVKADCVLVAPGPAIESDDVRRLAWSLENGPVSLHLAWGFDWVAPHRAKVGRLGPNAVLDLQPTRRSAAARIVKSMIDRTLGLVLLVVTSPLMAVMWLAVRLESRGPGFFTQTRVGLAGKPFTMYKMRTMCLDAEAKKDALRDLNDVDHTLFKIRSDPRVTRVGALLRRTSLDELPQLLNVVRGEMSLIGPRPALQSEVAHYDIDARRRMAVKPGMTGLWQVSGRSDLTWDESIRLDLHYADNWRLVDDVLIAARTVNAVARARGAY